MKAGEYGYWQSGPVYERADVVSELTLEHYAMKGEAPDVPRLQRTLVRVERFTASSTWSSEPTPFLSMRSHGPRRIWTFRSKPTPAMREQSMPHWRSSARRLRASPQRTLPWERRVEDVIDQATGTTANFLFRDDLIAAKLAAGRPQDLADVDAIKKATESQSPRGAKQTPETQPGGPA